MTDYKEVNKFKFPGIIRDQKGYGDNLVKALTKGSEAIKNIYDSSKEKGNASGWYEHRFVFIQMLFNKGCLLKIKGQQKPIDSSIFNVLDADINYMISNPSDPQEKQAVKTSRVVVESFLKGENHLHDIYSKVEKQEYKELSNRKDSAGWMKHYFGFMEMMFEQGIAILIPEDTALKESNITHDNSQSNTIDCKLLQQIKSNLLYKYGIEQIDSDEVYDQYEKEHGVSLSREERDRLDDECF